jgi:glutamate dehydrogenase
LKLFLTSKNAASARQRQKLLAVENLLNNYPHPEKRRFLIKLAQSLLFPECYLTSLPAPLLSELLVQCFEFIESKSADIALCSIPIINNAGLLMLIGAPNAPYFVDSIRALQEQSREAFTLVAHPLLAINRQENAVTYLGSDAQRGGNELFILLRLEELREDACAALEEEVRRVLEAAWQAFRDRSPLLAKLDALQSCARLQAWRPFIDWLQQDAFIPLAYRCLAPLSAESTGVVERSPLGMDLRQCGETAEHASRLCGDLLHREAEVIVQALPAICPIIRREPLIYIGFRERKNSGAEIEQVFFGLFNNSELSGNALNVPFLRQKIAAALAAAKISASSHDYLKLQELFGLFPKIDLFFLSDTQLDLLLRSLLYYLFRPQAIKLLFLASPSPFRISALLIIPRQLYRQDIETLLRQQLCAATPCSVETCRKIDAAGAYIALQLSLIPAEEEIPIDVDALEKALNRLARPWELKLRQLLERSLGKRDGGALWRKYRSAFSADYRLSMPPRYAAKDLLQLETVLRSKDMCIDLLSPCQNHKHYRLQFYSDRERFLDEYLPALANLNLRLIDQVQFAVSIDGVTLFIKSFEIAATSVQTEPLHRLKARILETIRAIFDKRVDNDALNGLLLLTGMSWKEIDVLRAYRNYYLQLGFQSARASFHRALSNNPQIAKCLFDYFEARFRPDPAWDDPVVREEQGLFPIRLRLLEGMETVADINDDRILRTLFNLVDATVRSNFHLRRDTDDYFLAFKINSLGIIDMPAPRPEFEIYVHAADMQGIHLRGGKIARGGIRWSDRPDDFRSEILRLMQTQISKNALIVPTGAKGGFVVKRPAEGESVKDAGQKAYVRFIRGLLDLTDNYRQGHVVRLPDIVAYDGDDPYLVVAADKGTAQFSDIANGVSAEYRFWLHDAFASGGSRGYNHKALGITARGAWECIKRHFRELGKDIQSEPVTVVGIGSMDGDVFGNAMLLSPTLKLLAAFSGQHIFIDPDPVPECSLLERKRLFDLPGSTWDDYDRSLISKGGGVYRRDAKDINISAEVRKWLGIRYRILDGEALIRYLLTARVDLLWLGGIGTYVKASAEKHEDVGDRGNDNVRVDASALQAVVVGEGANLGFTQKARIEYALRGGRINTDAVDNSAGVDTSDHEVNLKILLFALQKTHRVSDYRTLFAGLTDTVCRSVLFNNYAQSLCLSLDQRRNAEHPELFLHLAERLQSTGLPDSAVESFPPARDVLARPGAKLSRPELAVLTAACKRLLTQQLQDQQTFISAECCAQYLQAYFPEQIVLSYKDALSSHPLANAIKATVVSNRIINQAGCAFLTFVPESGNSAIIDAVGAYLTYDLLLDGQALRQSIYALDNVIAAETQYALLLQLETALGDFCRWHVSHGKPLRPERQTVDRYGAYLQQYRTYCAQQTEQQEPDGIPGELAQRLATIATLRDFPLIVKLTEESGETLGKMLALFNETADYLGLRQVRERLAQIPLHDRWERKALSNLQESLNAVTGRLVVDRLQSGAGTCAEYFNAAARLQKYQRYKHVCQETYNALPANLLPYTVLSKELENLLERWEAAR